MQGWDLSYLHSTGKQGDFPIGNVQDPDTTAVAARIAIEQTIGKAYGPIVHMSLAHKEHNQVLVLNEMPNSHTTVNCDSIIFPRWWRISLETLVADCACIVVMGFDHMAFMHVGRPELFGGLIQSFMQKWPDSPEETSLFIGPAICGKHYELPDISAVAGTDLDRFACKTVWDTQGYDVTSAIEWVFADHGVDQILRFNCGIPNAHDCPFCARLGGATRWGSDQYCRVKGLDPEHPYSPRDCAFLHRTR
jgi:copper oxidase (laccase) domain-containing protein